MKFKLVPALAFFLLLSVPSFSTAFYDDYQAYDDITNTAFTLNYTKTGDTWSIESADSVYLKHYAGTGQYYANLLLNKTKINGSLPVSIGFDLRNNSAFPIGSGFGVLYHYDISAGSGYAVVFRFYQTANNETNTTINLRRCSSGITSNHPSGWIYCGVSLANTEFLLTNDEIYHYESTYPYSKVNRTLPIRVLISGDGTTTIYFNNTLRITHTDRVYSKGSFVIGSYNYPVGAGFQDFRIDNLNITTELELNDPSPYTTSGYTILADRNAKYNKISWYDKTKDAWEVSYNSSTNVLNVSNIIQTNSFKVLKDGIAITYAHAKELKKNMTFWISANTHSCANFFKPTNYSESFYTTLGFDPDNPTAIPIYSFPVNAVIMPDISAYYDDPENYDADASDGVFVIPPYASMVCSSPTLITNVIGIHDNETRLYYTFKIYTGIGLTEAEIELIVPDADGETTAIPTDDFTKYLIGSDIETTGNIQAGPQDPYIVAERLFETDMIMIFVGLGVIGLLSAVGGFAVGGVGGIMWLMIMLIIGLIPLWVGLMFMGVLALGVAMFIKGGFT